MDSKCSQYAIRMLCCYACCTYPLQTCYHSAIFLQSMCYSHAMLSRLYAIYLLQKKPIHVISKNDLAINTLSKRYQYAMDTLRTVRHVLRICYRHAIHVLSECHVYCIVVLSNCYRHAINMLLTMHRRAISS